MQPSRPPSRLPKVFGANLNIFHKRASQGVLSLFGTCTAPTPLGESKFLHYRINPQNHVSWPLISLACGQKPFSFVLPLPHASLSPNCLFLIRCCWLALRSEFPRHSAAAATKIIGVLNVCTSASPSSPLGGPEYPLQSRHVLHIYVAPRTDGGLFLLGASLSQASFRGVFFFIFQNHFHGRGHMQNPVAKALKPRPAARKASGQIEDSAFAVPTKSMVTWSPISSPSDFEGAPIFRFFSHLHLHTEKKKASAVGLLRLRDMEWFATSASAPAMAVTGQVHGMAIYTYWYLRASGLPCTT